MDCLNDFQLFSEGKLYSSTSLIVSKYCISYRSHPASRRKYELIQEPDGDFSSEAQVNAAELTEVPNFDSEELKSTDFSNTTEGKPRCIIPVF